MIVFDLKCSHNHKFEAWFGSSGDYEDQKARGLVTCPLCNDGHIEKAVMAPAVTAKGNQRPERLPTVQAAARTVATMGAEDASKLQAVIDKLVEVQAQLLENSSWVGDAFADKARAMHYGDEPQGSIHGTTDLEEAQALLEEGIAVAPLPIPIIPPSDRN
ncbi:MAG TPA: DUF1178 family protein [Sphingobium sp.]|uniref:DUF1178 family protein n=1 Tax=Sphingobium sp. TaxID=1912891 RepID=UPI002ED27828